MDTAEVLWAFGSRINDRDWDGLATLLHEDLSVRLLHTGEELDKAAYVRLNREYPVEVDFVIDEVVADGERGVSRARTGNADVDYWVASFAVVRDGLIVDLVEVWTAEVGDPPDHRPT